MSLKVINTSFIYNCIILKTWKYFETFHFVLSIVLKLTFALVLTLLWCIILGCICQYYKYQTTGAKFVYAIWYVTSLMCWCCFVMAVYYLGIGKLSTTDGKAFADPEVLRRLSSSVSCALDEAAAALSKMKTETENSTENSQERYHTTSFLISFTVCLIWVEKWCCPWKVTVSEKNEVCLMLLLPFQLISLLVFFLFFFMMTLVKF